MAPGFFSSRKTCVLKPREETHSSDFRRMENSEPGYGHWTARAEADRNNYKRLEHKFVRAKSDYHSERSPREVSRADLNHPRGVSPDSHRYLEPFAKSWERTANSTVQARQTFMLDHPRAYSSRESYRTHGREVSNTVQSRKRATERVEEHRLYGNPLSIGYHNPFDDPNYSRRR